MNNYNDLPYYALGVFIMTAIFLCGYKIGSHFGWRNGFNTAKELEEQRMNWIWRQMIPEKRGEHFWDYAPLQKKSGSPALPSELPLS